MDATVLPQSRSAPRARAAAANAQTDSPRGSELSVLAIRRYAYGSFKVGSGRQCSARHEVPLVSLPTVHRPLTTGLPKSSTLFSASRHAHSLPLTAGTPILFPSIAIIGILTRKDDSHGNSDVSWTDL